MRSQSGPGGDKVVITSYSIHYTKLYDGLVAHVDVRRLQVEVQQLVRMNLAQAVEQLGEYVAHEILGDHRPVLLNDLLQRASVLV